MSGVVCIEDQSPSPGKRLSMVLVAFLVIVIRGRDSVGMLCSPVVADRSGSCDPGVGRSISKDRLSGVVSSLTFHDQTKELASALRAGCKASKLSYATGVPMCNCRPTPNMFPVTCKNIPTCLFNASYNALT